MESRGCDEKPLLGRLRALAEVMERVLPTLRPAEQLVYLQCLWLAGLQPGATCMVTQERLAHRTGLSRGTIQTALKALIRKKLLTVMAQGPRTPSLIRVERPPGGGGEVPLWLLPLSPAPKPPPKRQRLQELLEPEDRALLEAILEGLSREERAELYQEAAACLAEETPAAQGDPKEIEAMVAEVVLRRFFGPERLAKYRGRMEEGRGGEREEA